MNVGAAYDHALMLAESQRRARTHKHALDARAFVLEEILESSPLEWSASEREFVHGCARIARVLDMELSAALRRLGKRKEGTDV